MKKVKFCQCKYCGHVFKMANVYVSDLKCPACDDTNIIAKTYDTNPFGYPEEDTPYFDQYQD